MGCCTEENEGKSDSVYPHYLAMTGRAAGIQMLEIKNVEKETAYTYKAECFEKEHFVAIDVEAGLYFPIKIHFLILNAD